jgi:CheY-like chemotaxis protein
MRSEGENYQNPQDARGTLQETILLAEPDGINRDAILAWLAAAGFEAHAVADGEQCLEKLNAIGPDLILLSVENSDPAGLWACRLLKTHATARHLPIIILTASIDDETLQSILDAGGSDFVRKPVGRVELLTRVRAVLDQSRAMQVRKDNAQLQDVLETVGVACHDLNQPLQYVLGIVQVLMMDFSPGDDMYAHLDGIRARIEEMGGITRKLTDLTRSRRTGTISPTSTESPADDTTQHIRTYRS